MSAPTVVVTHWVHQEVLDLLAGRCRVVSNQTRESLPRPELFARLREAEAAMMFMPDWVDQELLDHAPRLKVVGAALKGFDNYDVEALTRRGVWLTNVPDLLTVPTAELAIGLMLALGRNMLPGHACVASGAFAGWRPTLYGTGPRGSTVGLVGLGRLGCALAERLQGWGARLLGCDPVPLDPARAKALGVEQVGLERLLELSDFVVVLTPLVEGAHGVTDEAALARMRPGALLVNVGRGSCVDELAVARALVAGTLGGYAADVFAFEDWILPGRPRAIPSELLDPALRTVFTPHLGSAVESVRLEIALEAARNILAALAGQVPPGAVNRPQSAA